MDARGKRIDDLLNNDNFHSWPAERPFAAAEIVPEPRKVSYFPRIILLATLILSGLFAARFYIVAFGNQALTTLSTGSAEQRVIQFPDGSQVLLKANSSLRFSEGIPQKNTIEAFLVGKARFRISSSYSQDSGIFSVITPNGIISGRGVVFSVNSPLDAPTEVVTTTGEVIVQSGFSLDRAAAEIALEPGQSLSFVHDAVSLKPLSK